MARITVEDCIDKFESRFELVLVASNRARKLHSGDSPTVEKDNDKNTVIALREIAGETINVDELKNNLVEEYQTVSAYNEEDLSIEQLDSQDENYINEGSLKTEEKIITDSDLEISVKENVNSIDTSISNNNEELAGEEVVGEEVVGEEVVGEEVVGEEVVGEEVGTLDEDKV